VEARGRQVRGRQLPGCVRLRARRVEIQRVLRVHQIGNVAANGVVAHLVTEHDRALRFISFCLAGTGIDFDFGGRRVGSERRGEAEGNRHEDDAGTHRESTRGGRLHTRAKMMEAELLATNFRGDPVQARIFSEK